MSVLITGGAGFIGSHLVEELVATNTGEIVIIDDLSTGKKENIPQHDSIHFIEGDVSNISFINTVFSEYRFEYIIHLAAIASVQDSILDPVGTHRVNFDATLFLLEKAKEISDFKRFIFASSAAVYGDNPALPCPEDAPVNPLTPYAIDKYSSERYTIDYHYLYDLPATAFRFFNIYGPRQNPSSPYSGVISIFAEAFKKEKPEIVIFGDGKQTRDFVYVKDLASIIMKSLSNDNTVGECINICSNKETSLNEIVDAFSQITSKTPEIDYKKARKGDIRYSFGDNRKLMDNRLITSYTEIEEGMKSIL